MTPANPEIEQLENEILEKKKRLAELRRSQARLRVEDYAFETQQGPVRLRDLFDGRDDLLIIHNMGEACKHCML